MKANLPTTPIAVSLIAALLWFEGPNNTMLVGLAIFFALIAVAVVDLRRLLRLGPEVREKLVIRSNLLGGLAFGQFVILGMPRGVEAQLLFAVFVLATLGVNMIEAQKVPASFLAFHVPFSGCAVIGYSLFATGTARWSTWLIILGTFYFPMLARVGFAAAAEAAELAVSNAGLIDQLRGLNERLVHESTHDQLTGLANRAALGDYLAQHFAGPGSATLDEPAVPTEVGALFVDLDRFKDINDTLGHQAGDELLTVVARRLVGLVNDSMFLGRFGGDEMIIIVPEGGEAVCTALAASVVKSLATSIVLDGEDCAIGASVGVATVSPADSSASDLVRFADTALYVAKACGRGQFAVYTPEMSDKEVAGRTRDLAPSSQITGHAADVTCS